MSSTRRLHDEYESFEDAVSGELESLDTPVLYDEMLDECYSFGKVGGPFIWLSPSEVLQKCDNVAYREGYNDWLDMEISDRRFSEEIAADYYDYREVEALRREWDDEESELSDGDDTDEDATNDNAN